MQQFEADFVDVKLKKGEVVPVVPCLAYVKLTLYPYMDDAGNEFPCAEANIYFDTLGSISLTATAFALVASSYLFL